MMSLSKQGLQGGHLGLATKHHIFQVKHSGSYERTEKPVASSGSNFFLPLHAHLFELYKAETKPQGEGLRVLHTHSGS